MLVLNDISTRVRVEENVPDAALLAFSRSSANVKNAVVLLAPDIEINFEESNKQKIASLLQLRLIKLRH